MRALCVRQEYRGSDSPPPAPLVQVPAALQLAVDGGQDVVKLRLQRAFLEQYSTEEHRVRWAWLGPPHSLSGPLPALLACLLPPLGWGRCGERTVLPFGPRASPPATTHALLLRVAGTAPSDV